MCKGGINMNDNDHSDLLNLLKEIQNNKEKI